MEFSKYFAWWDKITRQLIFYDIISIECKVVELLYIVSGIILKVLLLYVFSVKSNNRKKKKSKLEQEGIRVSRLAKIPKFFLIGGIHWI